MSDLGDVMARLSELSDAEMAALVGRATASRPGLSAVHNAAEAIAAVYRSDGSPDEPPTEAIPVVAPARRAPERVDLDRMEEMRRSLRRTIRPDR